MKKLNVALVVCFALSCGSLIAGPSLSQASHSGDASSVLSEPAQSRPWDNRSATRESNHKNLQKILSACLATRGGHDEDASSSLLDAFSGKSF